MRDSSPGMEVAGWGAVPHRGVHLSLALTSMALLVLEISLTRFFSYTIWYHFAYLTISVALLGFGSSGSIVAAWPGILARHGQRFLVAALLVAAVVTVGGISFLASFPIETQNLFLKPAKFSVSLLAYYVIVGLPFLLAGFSIGVPFAAWPSRMGQLYFWDLAGAALGCASVAPLMETFGAPGLIFAAAGLLVLSAAALEWGGGHTKQGLLLAVAAAIAIVAAGPVGERLPINITSSKNMAPRDEKGLPIWENKTNGQFHKWTALSRVDAWGWDAPSRGSFWGGIGVSRSYKGEKPEVARLTYDGSNGSDIYAFHGDVAHEFDMLEHHLLAVPYLLLDKPNVLVIGVGGGVDMVNALKHGARHVTGAELQPTTVDLLKNRLREFTSNLYLRDDVTLVPSEGRHFVRKSGDTFDLIEITAVDTFAAQAAGAYVLAESYLYTVDAMQDYLHRLAPNGLASIVVGDINVAGQLPPLVSRLAMISYRALEREQVANPGEHILVVAAPAESGITQDQIVLVRKAPFRADEVETVESFARSSGFHLLWAPGRKDTALWPLLGTDEATQNRTMESALFNVEATTDDNPFFYNVGKWEHLSPNSSIYFIMPGSFVGQVVLILMVLQSTLLGLVLVLVPLLRSARDGIRVRHASSYLAYFLSLGIGFMFVEISFVQKFVLFLGSPTYALSVTIFSLLLFSATGSLASTRFARPEAALRVLAPLVAVLIVAYSFGLSALFGAALHLDLAMRILISVLAQAPIGLALGMFMPLGIACIARQHPRFVPWAWGVNGVGSVSGTTLAVILAMAAGFHTVAMLAAALYFVGTMLLLRATSKELEGGEARPKWIV